MKYIFVILSLFILFSCSNKVTTDIDVATSSLDGYIILQNDSPDTLQITVTAILNDNSDISYQTEPDNKGYFIIKNIQPGNYTVSIEINSFYYDSKTLSATLFIDKKTSLGEITFNKILPTASVSGFVTGENIDVTATQIELFYKTSNNEYIAAETTSPDSTGFYSFSSLFPREIKLLYQLADFDPVVKFATLTPNTQTVLDTVIFDYVQSIPQMNIQINGVIDDGWEAFYINNHSSNWSSSNDFANFYAAYSQDTLYIAVDGGFDNSGNCVNIYIDKDYKDGSGINDFSQISGGSIGDHLRKNVIVEDEFGADLAFSEWALSSDINVVSLINPEQVDENIISANISVNQNVIEIAIPLSAIYSDTENLAGKKIAVVAVIGGGGDQYFADDTIPQQEDASHFTSVLKMKFPETNGEKNE